MSSFDRRTLLLMPLALAACGFEPVYAPGGAGSALYGKVAVSAPNSVTSYLLIENLEQRLGRSATSGNEYNLDVSVRTRRVSAAITTTNETNRYTINGTANYSLRSNATGQIVASGTVTDFVGYSAAGSTVSTLADERDANQRLMVILSDQIINRLYATPGLSA
ncbi:LPS assembly lipoprotein LptE [Ruegeria sp. Ofav3-42]|uniref:LPS assembly lipoprotein LptE n=1 Tax=Ruegeria sp. Ofav3-42 TaxID=2917759 RepID=UPI001EF3EDFF|nr:LPS assembly lipoprotein LptE [Ruegeria sp. Ofav3-42]MCG7520644.1 LPS assembly lipoprotein LptE [Ruegeria sp. Ofav3-42]